MLRISGTQPFTARRPPLSSPTQPAAAFPGRRCIALTFACASYDRGRTGGSLRLLLSPGDRQVRQCTYAARDTSNPYFRHQVFGRSATEVVQTVEQSSTIPIIREALAYGACSGAHLEVVILSVSPRRTGLGSVRQFNGGPIAALHTLNKDFVPRQLLDRTACPPRNRLSCASPSQAGINTSPLWRRYHTSFEFFPGIGGRHVNAAADLHRKPLSTLEDNLESAAVASLQSGFILLRLRSSRARQDQRDARGEHVNCSTTSVPFACLVALYKECATAQQNIALGKG